MRQQVINKHISSASLFHTLDYSYGRNHENAEIKDDPKITHVPKSFKDEIVQRLFRNFLDIMVLQLVREGPTWGYRILKHVEEVHGVKLRHGALYPLLKSLEKKGYLRSEVEGKGGRIRRLYWLTSKGLQLLEAYNEALQSQMRRQPAKAAA